MTPSSVVEGYERFGGPWRWRQHGPPKRSYLTTILDGITTQKTWTWNITLIEIHY